MNVKEAINLRKSIRKYQDKQIPEEIIVELLDAARKAPSAKNTQSHRYFIVNDQGTKDKLIKHNVFRRPFVYEAPLIIICCADPTQSLFPRHFEHLCTALYLYKQYPNYCKR